MQRIACIAQFGLSATWARLSFIGLDACTARNCNELIRGSPVLPSAHISFAKRNIFKQKNVRAVRISVVALRSMSDVSGRRLAHEKPCNHTHCLRTRWLNICQGTCAAASRWASDSCSRACCQHCAEATMSKPRYRLQTPCSWIRPTSVMSYYPALRGLRNYE